MTSKHYKTYSLATIKMTDLNKLYESYFYREIRNNRKPIPMSDYLEERSKGKRKKDGSYNAPTYEERLGYPRKFGKFLSGNKLDKKLLQAEILKLAKKLDEEKLTKGNRSFIEKRLAVLTEYL